MSMPLEDRSVWMADNPEKTTQIVDNLADQALTQGQGSSTEIISKMIGKAFPEYMPDISQEPSQEKLAAIKEGITKKLKTAPPGQAGAPTTLNGQLDAMTPPGQQAVTTTAQEPKLIAGAIEPPSVKTEEEKAARFRDVNQLNANRRSVGSTMNDRANAAVAIESWLSSTRKEFTPRMNNALAYAGVKGRGKRYEEILLNENPDALSDYDWFTTTYVTELTNKIKLMDKMGATDQQKDELHAMLDDINNVAGNPERARMAINKTFGTIQTVADAIFVGAEPIYKGVYRRMYDIKPFQGDYLGGAPTAQGQTVQMSYKGQIYNVSADKVAKAKAGGWTEVQ
jgi:hypothetical protein